MEFDQTFIADGLWARMDASNVWVKVMVLSNMSPECMFLAEA